jgi:hypothetical protein
MAITENKGPLGHFSPEELSEWHAHPVTEAFMGAIKAAVKEVEQAAINDSRNCASTLRDDFLVMAARSRGTAIVCYESMLEVARGQ